MIHALAPVVRAVLPHLWLSVLISGCRSPLLFLRYGRISVHLRLSAVPLPLRLSFVPSCRICGYLCRSVAPGRSPLPFTGGPSPGRVRATGVHRGSLAVRSTDNCQLSTGNFAAPRAGTRFQRAYQWISIVVLRRGVSVLSVTVRYCPLLSGESGVDSAVPTGRGAGWATGTRHWKCRAGFRRP